MGPVGYKLRHSKLPPASQSQAKGIGKSGSVQEGAGPAGRGARTEANASKKKVAGEVQKQGKKGSSTDGEEFGAPLARPPKEAQPGRQSKQGKKRGAASADGSVEGEHEESDGSEAELVERAQNGVRGGKSSRAKISGRGQHLAESSSEDGDDEGEQDRADEEVSSLDGDYEEDDEEEGSSGDDEVSEEEEEEEEEAPPPKKFRKTSTAGRPKVAVQRSRKKKKRIPDALLASMLELLDDKRRDEKKKEKKDLGGASAAEEIVLTKSLKDAITTYCKRTLCKRSFYPDLIMVERAANTLAKAEADGDNPSPAFVRAFVSKMRDSMTKLVRAPVAKSIKAAVQKHYEHADESLVEDASYRVEGEEDYGAAPFINVLTEVFGTAGEEGGQLQLSAGEVAFAELGVWLFHKGHAEFPKEDKKGQAGRAAHARFLAKAEAGINETALLVKAKKEKKAKK